ncbi:hypothetical protein PsorP6_007888 [Peronosclerospora sorghi]|uniref:Uncharacterized protein n=1 Tax=Peronosclerospora sorghi TaxID=230839 RepID=A0ACC0W7U6_9STRA|nr:hypothetical protein PsorP6_007888 [Peronosclerospora sorghi]
MEVKVEDTQKKAAVASSGALLTSLFVTPLDVAKVRIQSQIQTALTSSKSVTDRVSHTSTATSIIEQCRCHTRCACNRCSTRPVEKLQGSRCGRLMDSRDCLGACLLLWSSLCHQLCFTICRTTYCCTKVVTGSHSTKETTARIVAASITSPIELIRTRVQKPKGKF